MSLNQKQNEAVNYGVGPLLVLAGAGSGKTRVLTKRIARLVTEERISPHRIFAVTFTNKAAREMKHRLEKELGTQARELWVATFHSQALRILRRHANLLGYTTHFQIYDTSDQNTLMKNLIKEKDLDEKSFKASAILSYIDRAKNAGISPEKFMTEGDDFLGIVRDLYKMYEDELKKNEAMDFGDLLMKTIELFEAHEDIRAQYEARFEYILIDEYQDTNPVQYRFIKLLLGSKRNIFAVGDDDQSIYKFRGADLGIILNFQNDFPDAHVIRLEENYRSTQNILTCANAVIRENKSRLGKELFTQNGFGELVSHVSLETDLDEARYVIESIKTRMHEGRASDFAILYRTNAQSRVMEDELRKNRIPYQIYGGMKFYERQEIKDTLAYIRLLMNEFDSMSLKRVINTPARGIGKTTLDKLEEHSRQNGISILEVIRNLDIHPLGLNTGTRSKLKDFTTLVGKLSQAMQEQSMDDLLKFVYDETGYWQMLNQDKSIESQSRLENLRELANVISEYTSQSEDPSWPEFMDQVALATDMDKDGETTEKVTLMTVHLCKGLEFPVVYLVGLEEGLFPHMRSLDHPSEIEEERRLMYVGMTRAMKKLTLTHVNERRVFGNPQFHLPSRFLENLPPDSIESSSPKIQRFQSYSRSDSQAYDYDASYKSSSQTYSRNTSFAYTNPSYRKSDSQTQTSTKAPYVGFIKREGTKPTQTKIDYSEFGGEEQSLKRGMIVNHGVFGQGILESFEGQGDDLKVLVKFAGGLRKKLLFKFAGLKFS